MANPIVTIEMQDGGIITCELYPDIAPQSVYNFISLANAGFYNGLIFHRVIPILPGLQHRFIQMHHRHHRAGGVAPHIILVVPLGPLPLPDTQPDQHHTGQKEYDPPHNVSHIHPFLPYAVWRTL